MRHRLAAIVWTALLAPSTALGQPAASEGGDPEIGKEVFIGCAGCHNVLTDARKSGPSLRILFGKVRLVNGKRTTEDSVANLIEEGYNAMPSYKYMMSGQDRRHLMAYLKTLRARPEISPVVKPVRGSDHEVLKAGEALFAEHCQACHTREETRSLMGREAAVVSAIREGHAGGMAPARDLDDAELFRLLAYVKAALQ